MTTYLSLSEWAAREGISYRTALHYAATGKIKTVDRVKSYVQERKGTLKCVDATVKVNRE